MKTKTTLVRSDSVVELYTVTGVDLNLSLVIYPRNTEFDLSVRLAQTLQQSFLAIFFFVGFDDRS